MQAASYADVEQGVAKFVEQEQFASPSSPDISKHQIHEILGLGTDEAEVKPWWKVKVKCYSEDEKGKTTVFYVRYLVNADDIEKGLKLVREKEKKAPVQGEIEEIRIFKLDYMLIDVKAVVNS